MPVAVSVAFTWAFGTTAPDGSVTVPLIAPRNVWAFVAAASANITGAAKRKRLMFVTPHWISTQSCARPYPISPIVSSADRLGDGWAASVARLAVPLTCFVCLPRLTSPMRVQALPAPYQHPGRENNGAAERHLYGRGKRRRFHVAVAHPGDDGQFHDNHGDRNRSSCGELLDEVGQRVPDASERGHQARDQPAQPRMSTAGQAPVIGEGFGEGHADARAH